MCWWFVVNRTHGNKFYLYDDVVYRQDCVYVRDRGVKSFYVCVTGEVFLCVSIQQLPF